MTLFTPPAAGGGMPPALAFPLLPLLPPAAAAAPATAAPLAAAAPPLKPGSKVPSPLLPLPPPLLLRPLAAALSLVGARSNPGRRLSDPECPAAGSWLDSCLGMTLTTPAALPLTLLRCIGEPPPRAPSLPTSGGAA